jgi:hypothetical protein
MFEEAALDAKGADCLVCEGLTLSWDQVYRRETAIVSPRCSP